MSANSSRVVVSTSPPSVTASMSVHASKSAHPHETLASKALVEHLSTDDAASLGIDPEKLRYRPLSEVADAADKAVRVAGTIPVTAL